MVSSDERLPNGSEPAMGGQGVGGMADAGLGGVHRLAHAVSLLGADDPVMREKAVQLVRFDSANETTEDRGVLELLRGFLDHESYEVKCAAVAGLGRVEHPEAIRLLVDVGSDVNKLPGLRRVAHLALARVGKPSWIERPELIGVLREAAVLQGENFRAEAVRGAAMVALGNCRDEVSMPVFWQELREGKWEARDGAVIALGKLKSQEALDWLKRRCSRSLRAWTWPIYETDLSLKELVTFALAGDESTRLEVLQYFASLLPQEKKFGSGLFRVVDPMDRVLFGVRNSQKSAQETVVDLLGKAMNDESVLRQLRYAMKDKLLRYMGQVTDEGAIIIWLRYMKELMSLADWYEKQEVLGAIVRLLQVDEKDGRRRVWSPELIRQTMKVFVASGGGKEPYVPEAEFYLLERLVREMHTDEELLGEVRNYVTWMER